MILYALLFSAILLILGFLTKKTFFYKFIVTVVLLLISVLVANRPIDGDVATYRNDTQVYSQFIECNKYSTIDDCNKSIGAPSNEVLLGLFSKLAASVTDAPHFVVFFLVSGLFCVSCYFFYSSLKIFFPLAITILIFLGQFWEFNANVLRQTLSASLFLFVISHYIYNKYTYKRRLALLSFGVLMHSTSFVYFIVHLLSKYANVIFLYIIFCFSLFFGDGLLALIVKMLDSLSLPFSFDLLIKINNYEYTYGKMESFLTVIGKVNIVLILALIYYQKKLNCEYFTYIYKAILLLLIIGSFFSGTAVSYRVINVISLILLYLILHPIFRGYYSCSILLLIFIIWNGFVFVAGDGFALRYF
ncbi:EpsG family protein [Aeromonas caviae]